MVVLSSIRIPDETAKSASLPGTHTRDVLRREAQAAPAYHSPTKENASSRKMHLALYMSQLKKGILKQSILVEVKV